MTSTNMNEKNHTVSNLRTAEIRLARATLGKALAKSDIGRARAEKQIFAALNAHEAALKAL
jgi:hypothetical protein